jgi:hypothetical protein
MARGNRVLVEDDEDDEAQDAGASREPARAAPRTRTRMRHATAQDDEFAIPKGEIPDGASYQWKRFTVMGQEDPFYLAAMRRQGWEPVDPKCHPNWVPEGYDKPYIIRGGQILMERPKELTEQAEREVIDLTRQDMLTAEQRLGLAPKDTMTRNFSGLKNQVQKEMMRPVQIEE